MIYLEKNTLAGLVVKNPPSRFDSRVRDLLSHMPMSHTQEKLTCQKEPAQPKNILEEGMKSAEDPEVGVCSADLRTATQGPVGLKHSSKSGAAGDEIKDRIRQWSWMGLGFSPAGAEATGAL